jgi:putative ABC transport system substrate-binding protein
VALDIGRRKFITLIGGAAAAWPLAARAQQSEKVPVIGLLGTSTPSIARHWTAAFVVQLRQLGWIENRTVTIDYRWAEGRPERVTEIAAEFVQLKVDVIVTSSTPAVAAAKQATSAIPIVFAAAGDPVGNKLIASLAQPGGNVTGFSNEQTDIAAKRLELLHEVVPSVRRLGILFDSSNGASDRERSEVEAATRKLGIEPNTLDVRRMEDISPAFDAFKGRVDALYVCNSNLVNNNVTRINALALAARLPTMYNLQEYAEAGGLMSYGPSFTDQWRRAAEYVDKILRGTKPGELPVQQPTKFDLVINLKTAKVLGLTVPQTLLATADEVIE